MKPATHAGDRSKSQLERQTIGPYLVDAILGSGGMGVVYRALGPDGSKVAVKVLTARPSRELRDRFAREAKIRIDHPNVVRTLDAGVDADGTAFVVFELLEGESLDRRLEKRRLGPAEVRELGVQLLDGLVAAHEAGFIHRDIKPGNVFLLESGGVKLLDFGIAHLVSDDTRLTTTGVVLGSPSYLAPEQARGEGEVGVETDVWGVGAVLYHALSGRPPFQRENALATMLATLMEPVVPLKDLIADLPASLGAVVQGALQKLRQLRWPTARAMQDALRELDLSNAPATLAAPPTAAVDPMVEARTHRAPKPAGLETTVMERERRVVAVLLVDKITERVELERVIAEHGGVLASLAGDRAIALFGGERSAGDEISRAAAAAVAARDSAARFGIAAGHATGIGSEIDDRAIARAESCCAALTSGVAIDPEAARAISGSFALRPTDTGAIEISGVETQRSTAPNIQSTTLVGREAELAQIDRAIRTMFEEERAVAVLIMGPPGIGKSRLVQQVAQRIDGEAPRDRSPALLLARAQIHQQRAEFSLLRSALELRANAGSTRWGWPALRSDQSPTQRQHALLTLVHEALADQDRATACAEFLGELLGVQLPGGDRLAAARSDPQLMADRLRLALRDYLLGLAARGPLVLLLEDVQWADRASLALLGDIADELAGSPLLIISSARPELDASALEPFAAHDLIKIEPHGLIASEVAALAASVAGQPLSERAVKMLADGTGGNPLFVEQIVLALKERGALDGHEGELPVPITVEAAIQARLDALPAGEKETAKLSTVYGRAFFNDEVEALGVAEARKKIASLARLNLIATRARGGSTRGPEHAFRSQLVASVAYNMLGPRALEEAHLRAGSHLDTLADKSAEEIARHYERGGEQKLAAERYAEAALHHARLADSRRVLACVERAFALGAPAGLEFELRMAENEALAFLARPAEQEAVLAQALRAASTFGERARALTERVKWSMRRGRSSEALVLADEAVASARKSNEPGVLATALGRHAIALMTAGRTSDAEAHIIEAVHVAEASSPLVRALTAGAEAQLAAQSGNLTRRRDAFARAVELYAAAGDLRRSAGAKVNLADLYNRIGAYDEAQRSLDEALADCRRVKNVPQECYALANLGYALTMLERLEEASAVLENACDRARDLHEARLMLTTRYYRAKAWLLRGDADRAAEEGEQLAKEAEAAGQQQRMIAAWVIAGRAYLSKGDVARALERSTRAMELRDRLHGLEEDEIDVFLLHARALAAGGNEQEAKAIAARGLSRIAEVARDMNDQMRERFWRAVPPHWELSAFAGTLGVTHE